MKDMRIGFEVHLHSTPVVCHHWGNRVPGARVNRLATIDRYTLLSDLVKMTQIPKVSSVNPTKGNFTSWWYPRRIVSCFAMCLRETKRFTSQRGPPAIQSTEDPKQLFKRNLTQEDS